MQSYRSRLVSGPVRPSQFPLESLEGRVLMSAAASTIRSVDGSGNNLAHATWGATSAALLRLAAAEYTDGVSSPAGADRPSARAISNAVAAHPEDAEILCATHLSAFAYLWGQFIDHDMDLTTSASPSQSFNVAVPTGDASFDPNGTGTQVIPLTRSKYTTDAKGIRQQINDITAYLDGSMVYGSDATRAAALREFVGGRLLTSAGDLLPFNTKGLANANDAHIFADSKLFLAGDVRANENSELTALQTLFMREHNRLAGIIAKANPKWTDEQIYQQARRLVIGEIQNITFNEYLPALLGPSAIRKYAGYNPNVNAGISNEFSTAAFRLGHSMLNDDVEFINNDGTDARDDMSLADVFFNPTIVESNGIDTMLKYVSSSNSEEIDTKVVDGLRNFLFGAPGSGGLDLASLNIQRGRDHGLASYNDTRVALGLPRLTSFAQITSDAAVAAELKSVYGSVDKVDLWVGGLAENHAAGSNVGVTFQRILVDQFTRLRDGDRFWFERDLSGADLSLVRGTSLASIVKNNTTITNLQPNVFVFDVNITGRIFADGNGNGVQESREVGAPGLKLQLVDEVGVVVDTTTTGRDGGYHFGSVQLGDYTVTPVVPTGSLLTTTSSLAIDVTRGQQFNNVNFGVRGPAPLAVRPASTTVNPGAPPAARRILIRSVASQAGRPASVKRR